MQSGLAAAVAALSRVQTPEDARRKGPFKLTLEDLGRRRTIDFPAPQLRAHHPRRYTIVYDLSSVGRENTMEIKEIDRMAIEWRGFEDTPLSRDEDVNWPKLLTKTTSLPVFLEALFKMCLKSSLSIHLSIQPY